MRRSIVCLFAVLVVGLGCGSGGDTPAPSSDAGDAHAGDVLETPDGVSADEWRDVLECYREQFCGFTIENNCHSSQNPWPDSPEMAFEACRDNYAAGKRQTCYDAISQCGHVPREYRGDAG